MSDVRYQDVYGTDPQDSFDSRFAGTPVASLVQGDAPVAPANPLEYLYGSPQAAGETQRGPGAALRDIIQSGGHDAARFLEQMATGPYRLVQEAMRNDASQGGVQPLSDEYIGAAMDAGGLAMGGGMPFAKPGAVGSAGGRLMQPPKVAEPFYSAVEQAIVAAPQAKMTPVQWKGYLRNQPGVKAEELDWMGLGDKSLHPNEWGNKPVTREQMLEHAEGHGVKLKEIEKSGESLSEDDLGQRAMDMMDADGIRRTNPRWNELFDDYLVKADDEMRGGVGGGGQATKFSEYQLPGGDNYRELLLTTPVRKAVLAKVQNLKSQGWTTKQVGEDSIIGQREIHIFNPQGERVLMRSGTRLTPDEVLEAHALDQAGAASRDAHKSENFTSSHWDEPNVLVHMRMNDRYLEPTGDKRASQHYVDNAAVYHFPGEAKPYRVEYPQGTTIGRFDTQKEAQSFMDSHQNVPLGKLKSLHLEEIQSDWHQQGRKKGYHKGGKIDTSKWKIEDGGKGADGRGVWIVSENNFKTYVDQTNFPTREAAIEEAIRANGSTTSPVPDAPFKSTWADLALKRAITKAAHEGYDAVSWTPGAQQAERYDLSKHLDSVGYEKRGDKYNVAAYPKNGGGAIWQNQSATLEMIENHLGKEIAEKIAKGTGEKEEGSKIGLTYLKDLDLKVGGEGMVKFYDKMLVDKANALGKKFGAKVEWQPLPGADYYVKSGGAETYHLVPPKWDPNIHGPELRASPNATGVEVRGGAFEGKPFTFMFATKGEAEKFLKQQNKTNEKHQVYKVDQDDGDVVVKTFKTRQQADDYVAANSIKVPVLRLNDKLRDAANRKGMPLFSSGLPFRFTPVDHDPFADDRKPKYKFTPVDHDPFAGGAR